MPHGEPTHDLSSLRTFVTTGEPWNPEPYRWLFEQVGGGRVPIINCSGGTEVGACFLSPLRRRADQGVLARRAGDRDGDGRRRRRGRSLVGTGEVGELVCRQAVPGDDARLLARPRALPRDVLARASRVSGRTATGPRSTRTATGSCTAAPTTRSTSPASGSGRPSSSRRRSRTRPCARRRRSACRTRSRARWRGLLRACCPGPRRTRGRGRERSSPTSSGRRSRPDRVALRRRAAEDALGEDRPARRAGDRARRGSRRHVLGREPRGARGDRRLGTLGFRLRGENLMRLALAQINTVVGDLDGNRDLILARLEEARAAGADLVLFPELAVTGLPAGGPAAAARLRARGAAVARRDRRGDRRDRRARRRPPLRRRPLQRVRGLRRRRDAGRSTASASCRTTASSTRSATSPPGATCCCCARRGARRRRRSARTCGSPARPRPTSRSPARSCSSTSRRRRSTSARTASARRCSQHARARQRLLRRASCNAVGGQDELIFDGHSVRARRRGRGARARARVRGGAARRRRRPGRRDRPAAARRAPPRARARAAERRPTPSVVELRAAGEQTRRRPSPESRPARAELEQMRLALELGLRDYVTKNGFGDVVIGLSGGIDSALTAALAVEALGPERVHGVSMPSRFSSEATRGDAQRLAESLGIDFREIAIEPIVERVRPRRSRRSFAGRERDLTEENLQARVRGVLLMALSNKFGWLVVATGQQVGALGRLRDALRRHGRRLRAAQGRVQDRRVPAVQAPERAGRARADPAVDHRPRRRAPSCATTSSTRTRCRRTPSSTACSRRTSSSTARARSSRRTASTRSVVERALAMIDRAEYKRRQAPPGVKLRPKAFGRDRRTPITNRWQRLSASRTRRGRSSGPKRSSRPVELVERPPAVVPACPRPRAQGRRLRRLAREPGRRRRAAAAMRGAVTSRTPACTNSVVQTQRGPDRSRRGRLLAQLAAQRVLSLLSPARDAAAGRDPERRPESALQRMSRTRSRSSTSSARTAGRGSGSSSEPLLQRREPAKPLGVRHRRVRGRGRRQHEQAGRRRACRCCRPSSGRSPNAPRYASLPTKRDRARAVARAAMPLEPLGRRRRSPRCAGRRSPSSSAARRSSDRCRSRAARTAPAGRPGGA